VSNGYKHCTSDLCNDLTNFVWGEIKMKRFGTTVFALLALSSTGLAADLPLKAPAMTNAAPATSWAGLYFGGAAGMGLFASEFTDFGEVTTPKTITNKGTTFNVGGTAGYNWQWRSAVFGLEADGSWTDYNQTTVGHPNFAIQAKTNWFSTARVRAGLGADNILFSVTGGAAFADYKNTAQSAFAPHMCGQNGGSWSCPSGTSTGLAVGAGIEAMLAQNWSVKVEYLYLNLPSVTTTDVVSGAGYSWNNSAHILRFGANYHL
jgi:outer membrane immunogenic protein